MENLIARKEVSIGSKTGGLVKFFSVLRHLCYGHLVNLTEFEEKLMVRAFLKNAGLLLQFAHFIPLDLPPELKIE